MYQSLTWLVQCIKDRLVEIGHMKDLLEVWNVDKGNMSWLMSWIGMITQMLCNYRDFLDSAPFVLAALLVLTLTVTFG